ncbi:hypothetical protein [Streptomyces sp. NPDC089919]|uniref:SCO7613 C-terminal domain-containing membrane protein n=1 Tax=Streptomyces sp. NPDC089919 TaxID=3155188 RepID=UPI00342911E4
MENVPPPAEELVLIDRELVRLDARRAQLVARRTWLLHVLRAGAVPVAAPVPVPGAGPGWAPREVAAGGREVSGRGAQNVLLVLGAVLLAVAAVAFTVVSWGSMGIAGRAAVLGVVTAAALGAPVVLSRRGLGSTAEAVAGLGLVLTALDAYALYRVAWPGSDGPAYTAGAAGVLAALWSGYGLWLRGLRLPLPAAVLAAQLPLPLGAVAAGVPVLGLAWAVLGTAALDAVVALAVRGRSGPRAGLRVAGVLAAVSGGLLGGWALLAALVESAGAAGPAGAASAGAVLLAGAVVAWAVAVRVAPVESGARPSDGAAAPVADPWASGAVALALVAGWAAVAGPAGVVRSLVEGGWAALPYLFCAVPLLFVRGRAGRPAVRRGLLAAGVSVLVVTVLSAVPVVAWVLFAPAGVLDEVWRGRVPVLDAGVWSGAAAAPVVLLVVAAVAYRFRAVRAELAPVAWVLAWAGVFVLPVAVRAPYGVVLGGQVLVVAVAAGVALWPVVRPVAVAGGVCALAGAVSTSVLALAERGATPVVLGAFALLFAAGAVRRGAPGWAVAPAAVAAVVWGCGLLVAVGRVAGLAVPWCAVLVLVVPAVVAGAAVRLPRAALVPAEVAGAGAMVLALGLARPDTAVLSLALGLCGVVCAGTAVRADRRPAGYVAGVLFVLAAWVRLAAAGVTVPEAYTLPVSLAALAVGLVRRRRDREASSWAAYGPGLGLTLVPSVLALWGGDQGWSRPLLLGLGALAVTVAGAVRRLQAPLVLGGGALGLVALHELAPYVMAAVAGLPRWVPLALAGLLLLAVGATYEARLRDARRLRAAVGRMR